MYLSTFSIVACDPSREEWGVATQSKFLAVGALVPWARAGAGAVATQAAANTSFGPRGLELMATGLSAPETLERLLAEDRGRGHRQVGLVDRLGGSATYTGKRCMAWAGGMAGQRFACQGNILVDERTVAAMAETFVRSTGELADRLLAALAAAQRAGGDRRGQQSAAVVVVRPRGGYGGFTDRYLDLRIDDAPHPIARLRALVELHHLYFGRSDPGDLLAIDSRLARELQRLLVRAGRLTGKPTGVYDAATAGALEELFGIENLEERWHKDRQIDPVALAYLRKRFGAGGRAARQAAASTG